MINFKSVQLFCLPRHSRGRWNWLLYLAALASVSRPEKPAARIFCLARQTDLKSINLYMHGWWSPKKRTDYLSDMSVIIVGPNVRAVRSKATYVWFIKFGKFADLYSWVNPRVSIYVQSIVAGQIGTNEQLENSRLLNQIVQKVRQSTHTTTKAMCTKKK